MFSTTSIRSAAADTATRTGGFVPDRAQLSSARRLLFRALVALDEVQRLTTGGSTILGELASARSEPALNLNLTSLAAVLRSSEEINATPTSFSPFVPQWVGNSGALLTFGGIYDGSNGSGTLSFEARNSGEHGVDRLRIRVRDPNNNILSNVTIRENHAIDRQYNLGNGLFFTLGTGSLERFDTTALQVFENVGSVVDPNKPIDGSGNDNPNFQFGLASISAGSFELNGETIAVNETDSLSDVLDTINQSSAGVSAIFNALTERIEIVHNTPGSSGAVEVVAGDSNFVETTKLLNAVPEPGVDSDIDRPLVAVARFADVSSGQLIVNGQSVAVDANNDSLGDVITRINAADLGAVARFDEQTQRVVITGQDDRRNLAIDSNGTGLFEALNMPEGRVDPMARGRGYSTTRAGKIATAMDEAIVAFNEFFRETRSDSRVSSDVAALRNELAGAIRTLSVDGEANIETGFGLAINLEAVGTRFTSFATFERGDFVRRLQTRSSSVDRFLNGSGDQTGFLAIVGSAAQNAFQSLNGVLGTTGTLFDAFA